MRLCWSLLLLILACRLFAADLAPLLASHREMPAGWQATEITSGLAVGKDGVLYFVTGSPRTTARFGRFDVKAQRFEELLDLGTVFSQGERLSAPLAVDRHGRVWLASHLPGTAANEVGGWLRCYDLKTRKFVAPSVEMRSCHAFDLAADPARHRLLALVMRTVNRMQVCSLGFFDLRKGTWHFVEPALPAGAPTLARLIVTTGGDMVLVGPAFIYRYSAKTGTLTATTAALGDLPLALGAAALTLGNDGRVYGVTRVKPQLFAYDPKADLLTALGPAFGDAAVPGEAAAQEDRMALWAGIDGRIYYAGYTQNQGLVAAYDPRTDTRALIGALSTPAQRMTPPMAGHAVTTTDGRAWLAGYGWAGCGVYSLPPLPESAPWSTANRTYACQHIDDGAVTLDGDLSDPVWQTIIPLTNFVSAGPRPQPAKQATIARVAWSDTYLYFGYHCASTGYKAEGKVRDDDIWMGECAELFVCPRGADAPYFEIDANPHGVIYDSRVATYNYLEMEKLYKVWATGWNGMEARTRVERDAAGQMTGWTMEARVPFAALDHVTPRPGSVWLFLPIRIAMTPDGQGDWTCWHPTYADFHKPHQFPKLRFVR